MNLPDWRIVDGTLQAWFDAPSHSAGAALAERLAALADGRPVPEVDLRGSGLRIRMSGDALSPTEADLELGGAVSAAATELDLAADPAALQSVRVLIAAAEPVSIRRFWQPVLGFEPVGANRLTDPLRRDPEFVFEGLDEPSLRRNRLHVDVVRPSGDVERARAAVDVEPSGPYGLMLADPEGNELDLVPGSPLSDSAATTDWTAVFSAMTFYPAAAPEARLRFVTSVAASADAAGVPLMIDVRDSGVILDSGKDAWEGTDGPDPAFIELADRIQQSARDQGLTAALTCTRFVQFGMDAVDVPAVRTFWASVLGYQFDPRPGVTDIVDPRRLNPVLIFQPMDAADTERIGRRDRIHFELTVPADQLDVRVAAAEAVGGRVADLTSSGCTLMDPEGNRLDLVAG